MRKRPTEVLNRLLVVLESLQLQHDGLVVVRDLEKSRQQVLLESIQHQEMVVAFKIAMELQLHPKDSAPVSQGGGLQMLCGNTTSYVMRLLYNVQPATVQRVLSWKADDWHSFLVDAAFRVSLLLQLATRGAGASQPTYAFVADQQLAQVVDEIVSVGAVGAIYGEKTGQQLGICTSLNHVTMQPEAPPQQHWHEVLRQLQLSRPQLLKLAACSHEFMRQRKAHQELQAQLAQAMACTNSCTLQLLAAQGGGSSQQGGSSAAATAAEARASMPAGPHRAQAGAAAAAAAAGVGVAASGAGSAGAGAALDLLAGSSGGGGGARVGDDDGDAAAQPTGSADDPDQMMSRLLLMMNRSFSSLFFVLHNTLNHKQIACMLVASFPYVPRAAPIMEAAAHYVCEHVLQREASPSDLPEDDACDC